MEDDSSGNWLSGLLSTAKDVASGIQESDAARRTANATQNLANAQNAENTALKKWLPLGIGAVLVIVLVMFVLGRRK